MIIVEKQNGSLRVCLDPQILNTTINTAIKRQRHKLPTTEEIIAQMQMAVSLGYWQIQVDKESANRLTFGTSFGRRWVCQWNSFS